ncbi:MAG: hypothetical protein A2161_02965 [Candidatus Schekmanbacteria bacterium RBG_13_48_7]|uniref:DUF2997 domain-containing protein n=1 Tax=Candidatus Schekmanbacteria bacterium RBG_13_48_7 TaxID=1817878 RepID=A0A1F7S0I1_9BACT|nr:MAG: hypothetical protein A2161_02965 [Candidatus Schekmanbacteria bacterium RBG_13_48_7]
MTKKSEIEVEINEKGEVQVHVKGIKGKKCMEYVEIFQKVLGIIKDQKTTSEYYEQDVHVTGEIKGKVKS